MGVDGAVSVRADVPTPATGIELAGGPSSSSSSTWKTPLPYLFGGLAAMFFLIATSLLFLACSYRRYTDRLERDDVEAGRDRAANGGESEGGGVVKVAAAYKEKLAVIMPGDENPTCLATPRCYRVFDFVVSDYEKQTTAEEGVVPKEKSTDETTSRVDNEEANANQSDAD